MILRVRSHRRGKTIKRLVAVLAPGLIAFSMGQTVLFAVAGPVFRDIGLSESQLGIIISSAAVIFVISSGVWGRVADRWGRRQTIVFGLSTYGLVSLAFAWVLMLGMEQQLAVGTVFVVLLILRLLYAALGAGIQPASVALMADVSSEEERSSAVAVVGAAFGIGMVLGPASAALLVGFGVLTPLFVIAILGLMGATLAFAFLPRNTTSKETEEAKAQDEVPISALALLLLGALTLYVGMSAMQQTLAFNLQDLLQTDSPETARLTGFCFMTIAIATLVMQGAFIQIVKPRAATLLFFGVPLVVLGFAGYTLSSGLPHLLIAAAVIGIGFGLATPGLMSAASLMAGSNEQGRVAGMIQATMSAGFVIGPVTATSLYELERVYAAMLATGSACLSLVFVGVWLLQHRRLLSVG